MADSTMASFVRGLDPDEINFLNGVLNCCNDGQHPVADESTVRYFNPVYVAHCLGQCFQAVVEPPEWGTIHERVLNKLLDAEARNA